MDLNYYFYRQQVERSMAEQARSEEARRAHDGLAMVYELAITRATGSEDLFRVGRTRPD